MVQAMVAFWLSIKPTVPIYVHQQQVTTSWLLQQCQVIAYALHGNDGSVIWKFQTGVAVVASPSLFPKHMMPEKKERKEGRKEGK